MIDNKTVPRTSASPDIATSASASSSKLAVSLIALGFVQTIILVVFLLFPFRNLLPMYQNLNISLNPFIIYGLPLLNLVYFLAEITVGVLLRKTQVTNLSRIKRLTLIGKLLLLINATYYFGGFGITVISIITPIYNLVSHMQ